MRSTIFAIAATLVACSATDNGSAVDSETANLESPRLIDPRPCAGHPGFTCSTLTVPLDYRHPNRETLKLQVATADNADAPKGIFLLLTGGPGQPGVPFVTRVTQRLPEVMKDHRLVMIDQRGTGEFGAIDCPGLQAQIGSSDIWAPTTEAVTECAAVVGKKAPFYSSAENVADLDRLRRALGVEKMVVDGVSYGTITAARYAIAYPRNVRKVVLDSVAPYHSTSDFAFYLAAMRSSARILRDACTEPPTCESDPAEDLAWLVRNRDTAAGVRLFHTVVTYEYIDPSYRNPNPQFFPPGSGDMVRALREARHGDSARLDFLARGLQPGGDPLAQYSSGLHAATNCSEMHFPWGTAATPVKVRAQLLDLAERKLDDRDTWPFTPAVAANQGFIKSCQAWPAQRPGWNPSGPLPAVPILLLNGGHDMATPVEWAEEVAAQAPRGELVVVKGARHSVQLGETVRTGRDALIQFLARDD